MSPLLLAAVCLGVLLLLVLGAYVFFRWRKRRALQVAGGQYETIIDLSEANVVEIQAQTEDSSVPVPKDDISTVSKEKYKNVTISPEECRRLAETLEKVMRKDKPYMQSDLKVAGLAAIVGVSAHTLSYLFSQYLNRNYYDYVNDYRIEEFKRLAKSEEASKYTLTALAELCGFSSRASFFRYFKKATGITPNEYIHNIGKDDSLKQ